MTFIDPDDAPARSELRSDLNEGLGFPALSYPICPMTDEPCTDPHCARTGCEAEREDELR